MIHRDNFCHFCTKIYVVIPPLNCLNTVDQRRCLQIKLVKILQELAKSGDGRLCEGAG